MKLVANNVNGIFLQDILHSVPHSVKLIRAAVAYAQPDAECKQDRILAFCNERNCKLKFWGRLGILEVPISASILQNYLDSELVESCQLVDRLHAKVIEFERYGVYIGSANLTKWAWNTNVEAGLWLTEDELIARGLRAEIDLFFAQIDIGSIEVTQDIVDATKEAACKKKEFLRRQKADEGVKKLRKLNADLVKRSRTVRQSEIEKLCDYTFAREAFEFFSGLERARKNPRELRFRSILKEFFGFNDVSVFFNQKNIRVSLFGGENPEITKLLSVFSGQIKMAPGTPRSSGPNKEKNVWHVYVEDRQQFKELANLIREHM